jgi:hypothetical protein
MDGSARHKNGRPGSVEALEQVAVVEKSHIKLGVKQSFPASYRHPLTQDKESLESM